MSTPIANVPEINGQLNSKFTIHNEAIRLLEALGYGSAISTEVLDPPTNSTEGDIFIINGVGLNAWNSLDFDWVQWEPPYWKVLPKFVGLTVFNQATNSYWLYNGTDWEDLDSDLPKTIALPYTLSPSDRNKELVVSSGTGTFNIPDDTSNFPNGLNCWLTLDSTGDITIQRADGSTTDLITENGNQHLTVPGRTVKIRHRSGNLWKIDGELAA
ncbi:MAG: DUF2793 domain-containing protein [Xenococcus sp. (in: cyanobacteria)]